MGGRRGRKGVGEEGWEGEREGRGEERSQKEKGWGIVCEGGRVWTQGEGDVEDGRR